MKFWLTYINSRGNEVHKYFDTVNEALAFVEILDKRIAKKNPTCGGYILSTI